MNPKELAQKLRDFANDIERSAGQAIDRAIQQTRKRFKGNEYWVNRTGSLVSSFQVVKVSLTHVQFFSTNPIATYLDKGTKPYQIVPAKKKALSFKTRGGRVVTKLVNHPGIKARNFTSKESEIAERELSNFADEYLKKAQRMAGL